MEHWDIQSLSDQPAACLAAIWASLCCYLIMELSNHGNNFMGMCSLILIAWTPALHYITISNSLNWRWFIQRVALLGWWGGWRDGETFFSYFCRCSIFTTVVTLNGWKCGLELKHPYSLELSQLSAVLIPCTLWIGRSSWYSYIIKINLGGRGEGT